jgi:nucleotide-binding universal stress UspA family protein
MAARPLNIIVGYDGSDSAVRALDAAADLFGYGSTLSVIIVSTNGGGAATTAAARAQLHRRQIEGRYHETSGEPADRLVEKAEELEADLIVVGRRNGNRRRTFPGSVSSKVVRDAPCDVLVVR